MENGYPIQIQTDTSVRIQLIQSHSSRRCALHYPLPLPRARRVTVLHVTVEPTFAGKPLTAHGTEIRFLPGMDPAVHLHVMLDLECFAADVTGIRSLPGMCADVVGQAVLLSE